MTPRKEKDACDLLDADHRAVKKLFIDPALMNLNQAA